MHRPPARLWVNVPYESDGYSVAAFLDGAGYYPFPSDIHGIEAHHVLEQGKNNTAAYLDLWSYSTVADDPVCSISYERLETECHQTALHPGRQSPLFFRHLQPGLVSLW